MKMAFYQDWLTVKEVFPYLLYVRVIFPIKKNKINFKG